MSPFWMGIDGGGSSLRIVITSNDLVPVAQVMGATANPGVIGAAAAADHIRTAVVQALRQANLTPAAIAAVGVGIAGASVVHSASWLRDLLPPVLPDVPVTLSSDLEIALVGANGASYGVLILAGTGSAAYGINAAGQSLQVGGWGYQLGDEGSSYWIGLRALQMLARAADGRETLPPELAERLLAALGLAVPADLIPWLYRADSPRTRDIAQLARPILDAAAGGVEPAVAVAHEAAAELALLGTTVQRRLALETPSFAFAGGLLEHDTIVSKRLCDLLGLPARPVAQYPPVIGAVLLARMRHAPHGR